MALRNCKNKYISKGIDWKEIMQEQDNFLKPLIQKILQEIMEVEMDCSEQNYLSGIKEVKRH